MFSKGLLIHMKEEIAFYLEKIETSIRNEVMSNKEGAIKLTKLQDDILKALKEWLDTHQGESPTWEELGKKVNKGRGTIHKQCEKMRGIYVEWEDNQTRTLRLLNYTPEDYYPDWDVKRTLQLLAKGLEEFENRNPKDRAIVPDSLREGMSKMFLTSYVKDQEVFPGATNLPEFLRWSETSFHTWRPAADEFENVFSGVTLTEEGMVSGFAREWWGGESKLFPEILDFCRSKNHQKTYVELRKLLIEKPVIRTDELFRKLVSPSLRQVKDYLDQLYVTLTNFQQEKIYYQCPRCNYIQIARNGHAHVCRDPYCERQSKKQNLIKAPPLIDPDRYKIVIPEIYRAVTLPGIAELQLYNALQKEAGIPQQDIELWPDVDKYDLKVKFPTGPTWMIDVKDWVVVYPEFLKQVPHAKSPIQAIVAFPDERDETLQLDRERRRSNLCPPKIELKLFREIIQEAKSRLKGGHNA